MINLSPRRGEACPPACCCGPPAGATWIRSACSTCSASSGTGSSRSCKDSVPSDWAAPTRCADWSAHEVVRHLCDANAIGIAAGPDDGTLDTSERFDPRTSPRTWLAASAGESPGVTLDRFVATTGELFALARDRLAQGRRFDVRMPYGPMDWTVLMLHGFWDSWIHERDVLLARGIDHPTDGDATLYATAYGVFIAAAVASMFGGQVQEKLTLGGEGGGIFEVDSRGGVTLTVRRVAGAGPRAAEVADALAGRAQIAAALPELPTTRVPLCRAWPTSSTRQSSPEPRSARATGGRLRPRERRPPTRAG